MNDLAAFAPRQAEALQLSYFGGLNHDEIALALEVSRTAVKREAMALAAMIDFDDGRLIS